MTHLACEQVLERMRIESSNCKRSRPLVVDLQDCMLFVLLWLIFHHFDHVLDLVDMFVDESVMQETMAVVKPGAVL